MIAALLVLLTVLLTNATLAIALDAVGGLLIVTSSVFALRNLLRRRRTIKNEQHVMAKLRETKRYLLSLGTAELEAVRRSYRGDVAFTIEQYRLESKGWRRIHNVFQSTIIAGSIITTSVTAAIGVLPWLKWVAAAISLIVGVSASFTGYYKFRERGLNLQQTADAIEAEYNAVNLGIRRYRGREAPDALELFAEQVEAPKDEQRKREQQLEQPPELRQQQAQA